MLMFFDWLSCAKKPTPPRSEPKTTAAVGFSQSPLPPRFIEGQAIDQRYQDARDFLIRQYENNVKEIHERLNQESLLFALKFTLVGAVLAVILNRVWKEGQDFTRLRDSPAAAAFFWAAVVVSTIVDLRIFFHVHMIGTLGTWIRDHVETVLLPGEVVGWEHYLSGYPNFMTYKLYPLMRLFNHLLTLLLFAFAAVIFLAQGSIKARAVTRIGGCASFCVLGLAAFQFHPQEPLWWAGCLALGALGCLAIWRCHPPHGSAEVDGNKNLAAITN